MRFTSEIQAGQLIQAATLVVTIGSGILVGYVGLQREVYEIETALAHVESTQVGNEERIAAVERSLADESLARQAESLQLAGISAQLIDLKAALKK